MIEFFCRTQKGPAYTWLFSCHTFGRTDRRSFVSLDQILVPTHSLREKGTQGQRDKGTKGQRDKGTKRQRDKGTKGQWDKGTKGQWDNGTMCIVYSV